MTATKCPICGCETTRISTLSKVAAWCSQCNRVVMVISRRGRVWWAS
jgi:hypothetical protein